MVANLITRTEITPAAVNHIGWRTFLMFGIFCIGNGVFVFFFIKETKGRTLESMDLLFGSVDAEQRDHDIGQMLEIEKGVVGHHEHEVTESSEPAQSTTKTF